MPKVVTANELTTGLVVFLAESGWTHDIVDAREFADADAAQDGLVIAKRDEDNAIVVDVFVADTGEAIGGRPKMTLRDTIRAFGPTIQFLPADETAGHDAARG